jgi:hypothetical protein
MLENNTNIFENGLDERSKAYLLETTRWTKFLAILGFISIGFLILMAFVMLMSDSYSGLSYTLGKMGSFLYFVIMAALYFFPAYSLIRFSGLMKSGLQTDNIESITEGFRHQRNLFKYMGIISIIFIVIILLAIILAGIFAAGLNR